jgi:Ca-activated chloride channel family protein
VLNEGRRTLASAPVEVVEAEVTLSGPAIARADTPVRVSWSATIHPDDYITILPAGAEEGTHEKYIRANGNLQGDLKAPAEPGLYEIRYVLNEGRRTLARHSIEVVAADAPLDDGAGLAVPSQAVRGETITASWTGGADGGADQRIAVARKDQADFSWIAAHPVGTGKSMDLKMPNEAGTYEVRYLDVTGRKVLGRAIVEVK